MSVACDFETRFDSLVDDRPCHRQVSRQMAAEGITPYDDWIPEEDLVGSDGCITPGRKSGDQPE